MSILSTDLAVSAEVFSGRGVLYGLNINTDGVNNVTVTCYDNTSATGKIVWKQVVAAATLTDGFLLTNLGILCTTGLYVSIVGAGAPAVVAFYRNNAHGG